MSSNVVSLREYKLKREYLQPTLNLYKDMCEYYSEREPTGFYKLLIDSLGGFIENSSGAWVAACTHSAVEYEEDRLLVTYGSLLLDDKSEAIVSFKHLSENCTLEGDSNLLVKFLDNMPDKYSGTKSAYMSFATTVMYILLKGEGHLVRTEIEGDYDIVHLDFVYDSDLIRLTVSNLKMVELNERILKLPNSKQ